jgi:hypothetical protein
MTMQILLAAAPSSGLVLCVSADGCTAIEIVLPGTAHCIERDCDDAHAGTTGEDHACRDFTVLTAAPTKAHSAGNALDLPVLAQAGALTVPFAAPEHRAVVRAGSAATALATRSFRTTILQL